MKDLTSSEEIMVNSSIDGSETHRPDLRALSSCVYFSGWRVVTKEFESWAKKMADSHEPIWKRAGIVKAVMASTNTIHKDTDLLLSVVEKWCPNTNTFVFSWGEATITLEDVMVLLGFSVLGSPVFAALDSEGEKVKAKLVTEWRKIARDGKDTHVYLGTWIKRFKGCGDDELEHVAFLVVWLCYFVFPSRYYDIHQGLFPIAVHLSRGTRIALAPPVLSHLYAELSKLKAFTKSKDINRRIYLCALFKLVQVWTWERFRELQPVPNPLIKGETRLALWHNLQHPTSGVRRILDNSKLDSFECRPYTKTVENWGFPQFYPERAMCVPVVPNLDDEFVSFARCIKVSELVGIGCVEHYFPDRVASQFGMLQDVRGPANRNKVSQEAAWTDYTKPIDDLSKYIPSRSALKPRNMSGSASSSAKMKRRSENARKIAKNFRNKRRKCKKLARLNNESTMSRFQKQDAIENDDSLTIAQVMRLKGKRYRNVKNSGGDSSEPLAGRNRLVAGISDSGPCQKLDLIRADGDETIQPAPQKHQGDENNSSDPPLGFDEANNIVVSPRENRQTCEDELDVFGSNAEKMTIIDDGSKEPECLLPEEIVRVGEKEDDGNSLIQQELATEELALKEHNNEPTPIQKLATEDETTNASKRMIPSPSDESNVHITCLHRDNALGSEDEQLEDMEKRKEDVGESDDSYKKSLLKLKDSFEKSSHKLKRLESTIDELFIKAERNLAWFEEQRAMV